MARVIIQPAADTGAQQHLKDTIYNPVPLTRMHPFLEIRDQQRIAQLCPAGTAQVWGVRPGAKSTWAKIQVGDAAYFSAKNKLFLKATVLDTFENQGLAEDLWGNHLDGDTWSCIYLVGNVGPVSIPVLDFNITVGYKANAINQQFRVLNQPPSDRFFQDFDPDAGNEELRTVVRFIHSDPDRHGQAVARREQGMLRDTLLNNRVVAPCGICGHVYPPELLVAAHIKPRAKCTLTEKLDIPDVAMLMCTLGCDALYEKGYVVVHDGSVVACGLANDPIEIVRRLQTLHGRNCPGWNAGRSKYFRWHEANVGRQ